MTISSDNTKQIIKRTKKIDEILHCVMMVSNPCNYKRRVVLSKNFMETKYPFTEYYLVEIMYSGQTPCVSNKDDPKHLQIYTDCPPLWHKENALNIGIKKLLPENWKAVAWIDADIEFENVHWVEDTLRLLNNDKPVVCQLFSHALDLNEKEEPMTIFQGFGYQHQLKKKHGGTGFQFWHPGFAYACNRIAYEKMGGLYEHSILGSGDHNMALSFIKKGQNSVNIGVTDSYKNHVLEFQKRSDSIILRYTPGVIRHFFHGSKANRKYVDRWKILVKYAYDPIKHLKYNENGLLIPTEEFPPGLAEEIMKYFLERNEDEFFEK